VAKMALAAGERASEGIPLESPAKSFHSGVLAQLGQAGKRESWRRENVRGVLRLHARTNGQNVAT